MNGACALVVFWRIGEMKFKYKFAKYKYDVRL